MYLHKYRHFVVGLKTYLLEPVETSTNPRQINLQVYSAEISYIGTWLLRCMWSREIFLM